MGNKAAKATLLDAAKSGDIYTVKILVKQGADKDKQDQYGRTPLALAVWDGYLDVARYLVELGADKDKQDQCGKTPLALAAWSNRLDMVQYLVEQGADKEKQNAVGYTPLACAVIKGHLEVVRYLVEQRADTEKQDQYGRTPLALAAWDGYLDVVRYLVEQGADKDKQNKNGSTPLIWAAMNGHREVVKYLVDYGADKEKQDINGDTPLTCAAIKGHVEVVDYLVKQGADKEKQDNDGNTPLTLAGRNGHVNVIQNLVQNKADPTGIDKDGNTALLLLLTRSDKSEDNLLPVAKLLLEHGTPPLLSNNKGESARSVAKIKGFHHIASLVKEYASKQPQPALVSQVEPESEDPKWFIPPETITKVSAAIACGGFGQVYLAKWANSDVVVKEVAVVELRRFLKEVNTWRKLRHANVVPFYGANHRKEPFFIVSQYAANGELVEYLKREKKKGRILVWRKVKEVAAGLGYLHSQGVAHGDLKGNNIVVSDNGIAMLTDFGLSFQESGSCSLVKRKDELGAMAWRAPEFAHMTVLKPTRKSDVYSLGMCIIEAVTLKTPLSEYSNAKIRQFLRDGEVKVDKSVEMTEPQWNLVKQMIAVSPDERPNLSDVVQQLEEFADDEQMEEDGIKVRPQ
ncbi:hypothetical protein V7S43_010343 [Phytophthora oleae]|uniref:Protein kinase domain-containing protein n=1 Tax=Phytophthora oleae TaxID=2107226 RepID=A0ABD3FCD3_9STRA